MKKYILITLLSVVLVSCSEDVMDRINKPQGDPTSPMVAAKFQLTDGIIATGYTTTSGDFSFYVSSYTEQIIGVGGNQLTNAELRILGEIAASTTFDNSWNGTYLNLNNIKIMKEKCEEGGRDEGQIDILGMGQVLDAINWGVMTDLFGDIPCKEALSDIITPKVDPQKEIYNHIFSLLESAISNLKAADEAGLNNAGSQDIVFNGKPSKWLATAYAVKARYKLHLMKVDQNAARDAYDAALKADELGFDGFGVPGFSGASTQQNPWAAFFTSREFSAASTTMADYLTERNDPRYSIYIAPYIYDDKVISTKAAAPGTNDAKVQYSKTTGFALPLWLNSTNAATASIQILSKAELYFILAETGYRTSQGDYQSYLAIAINSAFEDANYFGKTSKTADEYMESSEFKTKLTANALSEIMIQKYIAMGRDQQLETYNDIRRCKALGTEYITLKNVSNVSSGSNRWPLRLPYGDSDVSNNSNVRKLYGDGSYVLTEPVWWAGGTR